MAQVTKSILASIIADADRGERYPLTVNELRQLAYMASESDGSREAGKTGTGLIEDDSAVPAGHSSSLLPPGDVEKVIERLTIRADYHDNGGVAELQFLDDGNLYREAIACIRSLLTTSTEENKWLVLERNTLEHDKKRLEKQVQVLSASYVDEQGYHWTPPTAYAYAAVCKARTKYAEEASGLRDELTASQYQAEAMKAALEAQGDAMFDLAYSPDKSGWVRVTDRLPVYGEDRRVVIYTEGYDFAGQQFFHIKADALTECGDEELPHCGDREVAACASHWIYDDDLASALSIKGGESNAG